MDQKKRMPFIQLAAAVLLALVFNLNAVTLVFSSHSEVITYAIFGLFIVTAFFSNGQRMRVRVNLPLMLAIVLYLLWSAVSMIIYGVNYVDAYIKFLLCFVVAYMGGLLGDRSRALGFDLAILIAALYAVYAIARHEQIYRTFIRTGLSNYLTITLPIGLALMFALVSLVAYRKEVKRTLAYLLAALVQTIALLKYSARGNLLFPFIVFAALVIFQSGMNRKTIVRNIVILLLGALALFFLFARFASAGMIARMTRLFTAVGTESRIPVYRFLIRNILDNARFIVGSGFGRSADILRAAGFTERYPHNFVLELVGEGGLFGVLLIAVTAVELFRAERRQIRDFKRIAWDGADLNVQMFFLVNGGLMFYLLSFFKSYSIYDGYQVFIFIAMILSYRRGSKGA